MELEELMRRKPKLGLKIFAMMSGAALMAAPALARDVTVYGGGKSKTYVTQTQDGERISSRPIVIAGGQARLSATEKRVERFSTERKIQTILNDRSSEDAIAASDAMMRIMLRGNKNARRQYSLHFPYYVRSADFYARLKQTMREQKAGVRVYRQSVLDDVASEDWQRVAEAMNALD